MPRVSVVIPNWNGMTYLDACIDSLARQTFRNFETVVVDNASTDGSVEHLHKVWPDVRVVALDTNRGFPGAVNAGIRASRTPYVVLLNNDTVAEPSWLERLVAAMDANPRFSFGSSKLVRTSDGAIDSAGHTYSLWLGASDNIGEGEPATAFAETAWIFGACAAASIYRRELFDDIGLYDEEFFFTHEDVEFDLRANVAGHRCLYIPDAIVHHHRGGSYVVDPKILLMGVRNRIWAAGKNLPPGLFVLWVLGKFLRVFWWVPMRMLGRPPSRRHVAHLGGTAWKEVRASQAARAVAEAVWRLPSKRAEVRDARRLGSVRYWKVLRSTRVPSVLG